MKSKYKKWTLEEVKAEAKKFNYKREFEISSSKAYNWAHRKGIIDEVCSHMKPKYKKAHS